MRTRLRTPRLSSAPMAANCTDYNCSGTGRQDLEPQDCRVAENLKFLDLTGSAEAPVEGSAVLCDHYRFKRLPAAPGTLSFYYATTGRRIEGKCVTHAAGYEWVPVAVTADAPESEPHLHVSYALRLPLAALRGGAKQRWRTG